MKTSVCLLIVMFGSLSLWGQSWTWIEKTEAGGPSWEWASLFPTPLLAYDNSENKIVTLIPVSENENELWIYEDGVWNHYQTLENSQECIGGFGINFNTNYNQLMKFTLWSDSFCDACLCHSVHVCVTEDNVWVFHAKNNM